MHKPPITNLDPLLREEIIHLSRADQLVVARYLSRWARQIRMMGSLAGRNPPALEFAMARQRSAWN